jgi:hypothetical protein
MQMSMNKKKILYWNNKKIGKEHLDRQQNFKQYLFPLTFVKTVLQKATHKRQI